MNFTECSFESTLERTLPLLRKRRNGKQLQDAGMIWWKGLKQYPLNKRSPIILTKTAQVNNERSENSKVFVVCEFHNALFMAITKQNDRKKKKVVLMLVFENN